MGNSLLDPSLGIRIQALPVLEQFTGDKARKRTPLDQFFFVVLSLGSHEGRTFVDSTRLAMHPDDAATLFTLLRGYLMEVYGHSTGTELSARVWYSMGPVPRRDVPRGYIFLAPGYFLIRKEKDERPRKEDLH